MRKPTLQLINATNPVGTVTISAPLLFGLRYVAPCVNAFALRYPASVSNGAFLIARAGLADHHSLTRHWRDAPRLCAEYPLVRLMSKQCFLKDGNLDSSRGQ